MRLRIAALVPLFALLAVPARGGQTFPYTAYVTAADVYVRSGPGKDYYPTSKLKAGDAVEVYRHDPGGWCAIRPLKDSFTWVSGRYLEPDEHGLATTTAARVAARVGSRFSDIRDVIQVRLREGETVELLGEKQFGSDPGSGVWYKIAPPPGEFRWVSGKFVDRDFHKRGVRKTLAGQPSEDGQAASRRASPTDPGDAAPERGKSDAVASTGAAQSRGEPEGRARHTNRFVEPAHDPSATATLRRISPREFRTEFEDIDMELSIMLAEEPTVWKFDELVVRAQALLTEAETAVERGRVRILANKIAESGEIKQRFDAVGGTRTASERTSRELADPGQTVQKNIPEPEPTGRFDGMGRLARVVPPKLGTPRFALVDERGKVRWFVTPAPGVNMNYYVGRRIGVNGIRGYLADKRAQHVTAKHVTPLDKTPLR
ncbi:MAG: SH3 domain-containing protein [Planctomycetes bacterium]|nr:SH3 domain-containing protein [Planctomycetota bacterium]